MHFSDVFISAATVAALMGVVLAAPMTDPKANEYQSGDW